MAAEQPPEKFAGTELEQYFILQNILEIFFIFQQFTFPSIPHLRQLDLANTQLRRVREREIN